MKCKEIIEIVEKKYAPFFAESWDNVGLLVGDGEKEVKKIFLALDMTDEVLEAAVNQKVDLIITHHPLLFSAIKKVTRDDFIGRRIMGLIENHICCYAMHTNFDVLGMADLSAEMLGLLDAKVLEKTYEEESRVEGIGRYGFLPEKISVKKCGELVKEKFKLPHVTVYGNPDRVVTSAAVCTGSGKSLMKEVIQSGAEVYVTGDVDYHTAIDAAAQGISVIDAGHYGTEYIFIEYMKKELSEMFPGLKTEGMDIRHPFTVL